MTGETRSFTLENAEPGSYVAQVCAANKTGWSKPAEFTFRVRARYDVMFDPGAGSGGPKDASVLEGESLTIGEKVPALEGFTFAGWTDVQGDNLAKYQPGDTLSVLYDTTFYAVWRAGDAVPAALTVEQMPSHRVYLVGQTLDTDGLILRLTYSDDTASLVTKGYTAEGFSAQETGIQTVTVTYEGLSAAYDVEVVTWFAGDINLDNTVNRDDVMALLWHITFPDQFPISAPADFTGDGKVNRDDVMQILWHITFPDLFLLEA
jgi:hypothetical protein